jgi:hypothetical protein
MTENLNNEPPADKFWTQFVPKSYRMDPETEDVLYGEKLRDGMIVLYADDNRRESIPHIQKYGTDDGLANALLYNRWVTVSDLGKFDENLTFIGVYSDGTKKQHTFHPKKAWYVKLDSIPEEDPLAAEEAELKEAMASLVETSKVAWSGILDMLKEGIKEEADLLDEAASKLHENAKNVKSPYNFYKKPEDLGDVMDDEGLPYFRKATVHDVVRNFVNSNMDFFTSKEVHSLNEIHPRYNHYCDQKGMQFKLSRNDCMQHMKTYFRTWASVEQKDEHGTFEADTQLIGFFNPHDVEAGYSEVTNNAMEDAPLIVMQDETGDVFLQRQNEQEG